MFEAHSSAASAIPSTPNTDANGSSTMNGHGYGRLAAYGAAHLWSLCPSAETETSEVFFNVSRERDECWKVTLHLVPLADSDGGESGFLCVLGDGWVLICLNRRMLKRKFILGIYIRCLTVNLL